MLKVTSTTLLLFVLGTSIQIPVTVYAQQESEPATHGYSDIYDFSFQSMDIEHVLSEIALIAQADLQFTAPLVAKINLEMKQVSVQTVLNHLVQSYNLTFTEEIKSNRKQWIIGSNLRPDTPSASHQSSTNQPESAMVTQYFAIKHYDTKALADLILNTNDQSTDKDQHNAGFLSNKASILVDQRGRQIIIRDSKERLWQIAEIISKLDVPQKQILLEANIVIAKAATAKALGVRWGSQITQGNISFGTLQNNLVQNAAQSRFTTPLMIDLGVINEAAARFQTNYKGSNTLIELELSALELEGQVNIISKPKVATIDGQTARISSGIEVPFTVVSGDNKTNTAFKEATLSLEVKARIIEDKNIAMEISINQDAIGELYGGLPSIDTNKLYTKLRTANQQTIVLGGILQSRQSTQISKVPFLGDLPVLKWLFRRESQTTEKAELLIFITPKIINE